MVVMHLLAAGADLTVMSYRNEMTALHEAAANGHSQVVAQLLEACPELVEIKINEWTPLYCAASNGHENVVAQLIAAKAEVNNEVDISDCGHL